jgi:hypothetical protein
MLIICFDDSSIADEMRSGMILRARITPPGMMLDRRSIEINKVIMMIILTHANFCNSILAYGDHDCINSHTMLAMAATNPTTVRNIYIWLFSKYENSHTNPTDIPPMSTHIQNLRRFHEIPERYDTAYPQR